MRDQDVRWSERVQLTYLLRAGLPRAVRHFRQPGCLSTLIAAEEVVLFCGSQSELCAAQMHPSIALVTLHQLPSLRAPGLAAVGADAVAAIVLMSLQRVL